MTRAALVAWTLLGSLAFSQTQVAVKVLEKPEGRPIEDLSAADFVVEVDGQLVEVKSAKRVERPLDLILIVEERRWRPLDPIVHEELGNLAAHLTDRDRVGLLVAGVRVRTELEPDSSADAFAVLLARERVNLATRFPDPRVAMDPPALFDAIAAAASHDLRPEARRAAIVLGAGWDASAVATEQDARQAALAKRLIVAWDALPEAPLRVRTAANEVPAPGYPSLQYPPGLELPPPVPPRPPARRSDESIADLVRATGGEERRDWKGGRSVNRLADSLRTRYELELQGSVPGDLTVELSPAVSQARQKAVVLAPARIVPGEMEETQF